MGRRILALFPCILAVVVSSPVARPEPDVERRPPRIFLSDSRDLARVKQQTAGDSQLAAALVALRARADRELKAGPFTIVNKPKAPPSGDKHDYLSMAPYFWPDPTQPHGLPYIPRHRPPHP